MLILNSKQHGPSAQRKPQRFNLGGILKKNFAWKKSVNSLASTLDTVQLDYPSPAIAGIDAIPGSPPQRKSSGVLQAGLVFAGKSHGLVPSASSAFGDNYTTYPACLSDVLIPRSENAPMSSSESSTDDTPFNTECISLLNSDLTSEMNMDNVFDSYFCCSKPASAESDVISFNEHSEEKITDYSILGYHPVKIGDEFTSDISRYRVLRKLGWGHFSTVWLCSSLISGQFVALKIVKLGRNYTEAALDEISILRLLQEDDKGYPVDDSPVVSLLDHFTIQGPNGTHIAMAFELMGENLLHLIFQNKSQKFAAASQKEPVSPYLLPVDTLRLIIFQLLQGTDYMHRHSVIHTDIKPENILITHKAEISGDIFPLKIPTKFQILPSKPLHQSTSAEEPIEIKVADLGNATFCNLHLSDHIQTRQYRAPEILLGHSWGALADVWSIGCLIFELLTGDYLFEPNLGASFTKDEDHLAQIIELLGVFPSMEYAQDCERYRKYFLDNNSLRHISKLKFWSLESVLEEKYKFDMADDNIKLLCDLLLKCLRYDLSERYDCGSLMAHPFFKKDAKFDQRECDELPNNNFNIPGFTCEEQAP